jgi:hypothetical protein
MGRILFEPLALFLSPFAVYALCLAAAVLGLVAVNAFAPRGRGVYVPAHVENGILVPGRIE